MRLLIILFFISLLFGQLVRIPIGPGITIYPHDLMAIFLLGYWMLQKPKLKTHFALLTPIRLFLLAALISLAVNIFSQPIIALGEGFAYCGRFFLYAGLYFLVKDQKKIRWDLMLYGTGVAFSLLGTMQYMLYPDLRNLLYLGWDPHFYRLFSTFLDPNFAGLFIVLTFILGLYVYRTVHRKLLIIFSQLFLLLTLILTLSRSSWISFLIPLGWLIWKKRSWKIFAGLGVFVMLLFFLPLPYRNITPVLRQESGMARVNNWIYSIELFKQKPIFGYGFNLLRSVQEPVSTLPVDPLLSHAGAGLDNSFLFVLVTTGVVGGAAWIYLLFSMGEMGVTLTKQKGQAVLGEVYLLSLLAICVHSVFVNSFFYPWIMIWMWVLSGFAEQTSSEK